MPTWFYHLNYEWNSIAFVLIIGSLLFAALFVRDYFRSLKQRRQKVCRGFDIVQAKEFPQSSNGNTLDSNQEFPPPQI